VTRLQNAQFEAAREIQYREGITAELSDQYKITKITVTEVVDKFPQYTGGGTQFQAERIFSDESYDDRANPAPGKKGAPSGGKSQDGLSMGLEAWVDDIVNAGTKAWSVIEAGRPVAHDKLETASALPKGADNWTDLQNWSAPTSRSYSVQYENGFGYSMIDFTFRITFNYGGNFKGHGKYIANAAVQIENLRIGFGGIKFDVEVDVASIYNRGTSQEPLAGMQINVNRIAETVFSRNENTDSFHLDGRGIIQKL
jgi:hypothetical protein